MPLSHISETQIVLAKAAETVLITVKFVFPIVPMIIDNLEYFPGYQIHPTKRFDTKISNLEDIVRKKSADICK